MSENVVNGCSLKDVRGQSMKKPNFFFTLVLYLQLNQTCLLQSAPLLIHHAQRFFSPPSSGTCFAGWREGPLSNFLLSPLPSEIGDLLARILTILRR